MAKDPAERWPDPRSFGKALQQTQGPDLARLIEAIGGREPIIGAVIVANHLPAPPPATLANSSNPRVTFGAIDYVGPPAQGAVADSLGRLVRSDLRDHIDFVDSASLVVQARMTVTGGDVALRLTGGIPTSEFHVPLESWPTLSDSTSYQIVLGVWRDRSPLAASLPPRALPHRAEGLAQFLEAEQLVGEAEWEEAAAGLWAGMGGSRVGRNGGRRLCQRGECLGFAASS